MDLNASKVFSRAVDSVRIPLEHFIKTGFYDPHSLPGHEPEDIADFQVRRVCRQIAKESKRPFIRCYEVVITYRWDYGSGWTKLDKPEWERGFIEMPKRHYLAPLIAPLLLAAPEAGSRYDPRTGAGVHQQSLATLWSFSIFNRELWDQYYQFVLTDPECRKARRLTS